MNGETSREEKTPDPSSSTPASPPTAPDENWIEELMQKYSVSIMDYKLSMYRAEIAEARAESRINMRALIKEVWQAASVRAASTGTGWISVEDRLPALGVLVLVANQAWPQSNWPAVMQAHVVAKVCGEAFWCGHYADLESCGQPTEKGLPTDEPTHWQPFPAPPVASQKGETS
jgi:hypothetical protein